MTAFTSKKIIALATLGEKLEKHRRQKGLTREKAARLGNINIKYIKHIEKNDYSKLPADIYTINILRRYSELLNLNPATAEEAFRKEKTTFENTRRANEETKNAFLIAVANFFLNPRVIKYGGIIIISLALLTYIGMEANKAVSPPTLSIDFPSDNIQIDSPSITIQGHTEKEVQLRVNNRPLLADQSGNFYLQLDLQKGLNVIKISAQKKYSKPTVVYRRIIVN